MKCHFILTLCALVGFAAALDAKSLVIVEDGRPRAVIIVEPAPPAVSAAAAQAKPTPNTPAPMPNQQRLAAEEIQKYVRKISGTTLPIVAEDQPIEGKPAVRILVGRTQTADKLGVKVPAGFDPAIRPEAFTEEGYTLRTGSDRSVGDYIVVAGNQDGPYQGTLYAAYALLEKLGCRWYFPGEFGEVVPESRTVTVPELNITSRPDFAMRGIWLSGWVPMTADERAGYSEWGTRIGFNLNKSLLPGAGDGSLARLLPTSEYFETKPEYYAMNQSGQRYAGKLANGKYSTAHTMLCLSNPEVLTESIKNLKAAFAGEKAGLVTGNSFGISPPDGTPYCYCLDCKAASQNFNYPTYVHRTMQSEEFFTFAAKLAREFPDKWVGTMAYSLRETPPQGVSLPPNIVVTCAPISSDVLHPLNTHLWRRKETLSIISQWCKLSNNVMLYDYSPGFLLGMWVPERDTANMAINVPIYHKLGMKGFRREGRKAFMQTWLTYYVCGKLFWDADTDVAAIKKDFYTTFFGPEAGPHVQAWWDACEDALLQSPMQAHEDWLINHIYTLEFVKGIQQHVEAARAAKMSDAQQQRFAAFDLIAQHLMGYARMHEAERNLDYKGAAVACQQMTDCKMKLNAISSYFITVAQPKPPAMPSRHFAEGIKLRMEALAALIDGTQGKLVAPLPLEMKFTRDRFNEGVIGQWYAPGFNDAKWGTKNTFLTWDQQDPPEDAAGHDYDGYGWYRTRFNVDKQFAGKPVRLYIGGVINEAWVWVNGQYAGHRPHRLWWSGAREVDIEVTNLIKPGGVNTVSIRVWNDAEIGGLYRRGFFYSPAELGEAEKGE
jgi:hypothetical protein